MGGSSDIIRSLLVIIPGFVVLGMSIMVLRLYWVYYRNYVWKPRSELWKRGYHVWAISIAYDLFVIAAIFDSFSHFGWDLTWRVPFHALAIWLGIFALALFARTERGRVHEQR